MQKNFIFGLLLTAGVLLNGTCVYAQENAGNSSPQSVSADNYAWRLDGIRLNTVVTNDGIYTGTMVDDVNYFYAPDSMTDILRFIITMRPISITASTRIAVSTSIVISAKKASIPYIRIIFQCG